MTDGGLINRIVSRCSTSILTTECNIYCKWTFCGVDTIGNAYIIICKTICALGCQIGYITLRNACHRWRLCISIIGETRGTQINNCSSYCFPDPKDCFNLYIRYRHGKCISSLSLCIDAAGIRMEYIGDIWIITCLRHITTTCLNNGDVIGCDIIAFRRFNSKCYCGVFTGCTAISGNGTVSNPVYHNDVISPNPCCHQ